MRIAATPQVLCRDTARLHFFIDDQSPLLRLIRQGPAPDTLDFALFHHAPRPTADAHIEALFDDRFHLYASPSACRRKLKGRFAIACSPNTRFLSLALAAGIPVLATPTDPLHLALVDLFRLPHTNPDQIRALSFADLFDLADPAPANEAYPALYRGFVSWLIANGLSPRYQATDPDRRWRIPEPRLVPLRTRFSRLTTLLRSSYSPS